MVCCNLLGFLEVLWIFTVSLLENWLHPKKCCAYATCVSCSIHPNTNPPKVFGGFWMSRDYDFMIFHGFSWVCFPHVLPKKYVNLLGPCGQFWIFGAELGSSVPKGPMPCSSVSRKPLSKTQSSTFRSQHVSGQFIISLVDGWATYLKNI